MLQCLLHKQSRLEEENQLYEVSAIKRPLVQSQQRGVFRKARPDNTDGEEQAHKESLHYIQGKFAVCRIQQAQ